VPDCARAVRSRQHPLGRPQMPRWPEVPVLDEMLLAYAESIAD
jgi:hypothetical protein